MRDLSSELQRQDHLHVNVNDFEWKAKGTRNDVKTIHRQLRIMLANFFAVVGLSWCLDQKKSVTEPTLISQRDHGIEWQKK